MSRPQSEIEILIKNIGKCSKISNTFLILFSNKMLILRAGIHKILIRIANREGFFRSSLIWVCAVCLGLFSKQLVFEILEHLPYHLFVSVNALHPSQQFSVMLGSVLSS